MVTKAKANKKQGDSCVSDDQKLLDKLTKELYVIKQQRKQIEAEHKRLEKAVKTLLEGQDLDTYETTAIIDRVKVDIVAEYPQKFKSVVDIEKLAAIAKTKKVFFSMITATQGAVKEVLGENALARVITEVPAARTLTLKKGA